MARKGTKAFTIRFEHAEEGGYLVTVPELPGCVTEGDTFAEAMEMVMDAMAGLLQVAVEHGDPIPEPFVELVDELVEASAAKPQRVGGGRQTARSQVG